MPGIKNILKTSVLALLLFASGIANAQQSLTLYNMPVLAQSAYTNPAQIPQCRLYIGIPMLSSVYFNFGNSGFRPSDLLQPGTDSINMNVNNMIGKLHKNNYLSQSLQIDILSMGIKIAENYFSFNITEKENIGFSYQKNFITWAWQGNGAFLGQDENFNFGLFAMHYREYGIGWAHPLTDKLTVGAKLKYLYGMEDVWAQHGNIVFNTATNDYGYTTSDNVRVNTSGIDSNSFNNISVGNYLFGKHNGGMAIDLGAQYKLNDKITLSASVLDLGYIKWLTSISNYTSNGQFNFDGIDISQFVSGGDSALTKLGDSVKNTFDIKTTHSSYTTMLPAQVYLGANYSLSENQSLGGVVYSQIANRSLHMAAALSYTRKFNNWLSVTGNYAFINRDFLNLGLGLAVTGPVQWYILTDNVIGLFVPQSVRTVNIRTGISLCFGRKADKKATKASFDASDPTPSAPPKDGK